MQLQISQGNKHEKSQNILQSSCTHIWIVCELLYTPLCGFTFNP